jgi:hypothetical protein
MIENDDKVFTRKGDARAWHRLDVQVDGFDALEVQGHFDYTVMPTALHTEYGDTGSYGLVANRNGKLFRLCTPNSVVDQPKSLLGFFEALTSNLGAQFASCGSLENLGRYFFSAEIPSQMRDLGGSDKLESHIVLTGSYDGSHPQRIMLWSIRPVCNNTLPSAAVTDGTIWRSRAGKSERLYPQLAEQIASAIASIPMTRRQQEADVFGKLTSTKIDTTRDVFRFAHIVADQAGLLKRVLDLHDLDANSPLLEKCIHATLDKQAWMQIRAADLSDSARKIAVNALEGLGADLPTARETAFGLLNGATQTFDHQDMSMRIFQTSQKEKETALLLASAIANTQW